MDLSVITRDAVLAAIGDCDRLGRSQFLDTYGYSAARRYVLVHEGVFYDSKAIVGVAHRHVASRALRADEFSGGLQTVVRLLERLGFEVAADPGDAVSRLVTQIERLRVASTPDGPARHQPILLLWAMGRARHRLPRLVPWVQAQRELRSLLRTYGQPSSRPRPDYPFLALAATPLWELRGPVAPPPPAHGDAGPLRWLDEHEPQGGLTGWAYELVAGSDAARTAATSTILDRFFADTETASLLQDVRLTDNLPDPPTLDDPETYRRLVESVEDAERRGDDQRQVSTARRTLVRSEHARRAVLVRSGGHCENPLCGGQPEDVTDQGEAILEVDHVDDRAGGGRDHPVQMIALCPNCHAIKTRGRTREDLRTLLRVEAQQRHSAWVGLWPGVWVSPDLL